MGEIKQFTENLTIHFIIAMHYFSEIGEKNEDYERYPEYLIHDSYCTVIRQVNTNLSDWYLYNVMDYRYALIILSYYRYGLSWIPGIWWSKSSFVVVVIFS